METLILVNIICIQFAILTVFAIDYYVDSKHKHK